MILKNEDIEVAALIEKWLKERVAPVCGEMDENHEFPQELYDDMVYLGLSALAVPEEYGGPGLNNVQQTVIAEMMGKYEPGLGSAVGVNESNTHLINMYGTEEQKKLFYDCVLQGWSGFCLTEPGAGSDAAGVRTTAVEDGDEYVINGTKCFITNGGIADLYCVFASTDPSQGVKGISCFLVERSRPGVSIGKIENKLGIRLSNTAEVIFEDVRVPKDHLVGELNKGFKIAMNTLDISRLNVGAMGVGLAMRCLEEAITYAKTRVQFGKPIAKLGAIQTKIADMGMDVESTNQLVLYAAELMDAKQPFARISCMAKCRGADVANRAATEALQIFGGYGYMKDYPMEKMFRDAKILQIYEGTCEVQRQVIAGTYLR